MLWEKYAVKSELANKQVPDKKNFQCTTARMFLAKCHAFSTSAINQNEWLPSLY
jgi:hypothetical protein